MKKNFAEALQEVRKKSLNEFLDSKGNPKDPKELGSFSTNNQSPYGFAKGGSDEDTAANFFASDKRMMDAQKAEPAPAPSPAPRPTPRPAPRPTPTPTPPPAPQRDSQSSAGNGDILGGRTAAPVAPASSGDAGRRQADQIANTDRALETAQRSGQDPAAVTGANRAAQGRPGAPAGDAGTATTPRTLGVIAGATGGNAADERARAEMKPDERAEIDKQAADRQAKINAEREANLAKQRAARQSGNTTSTSLIDRIKNIFKSPTQRPAAPAVNEEKMNNKFIEAFEKIQNSNHSNMFEAAKKAKKDYDGDGKVESEKDEVWGSRFKAAKKAGKMEEGVTPPASSDPDFAAPRPDGTKKDTDIPYKPEDKKPESVPLPPKRPAGLKETYLNMLKKDH